MRIEAMKSFIRLVEAGSYAAAAESLYLSPTTLHSHVRSLETELGATLVVFAHRRLELTRAGSHFLVFAERTLGEYERFADEVSGFERAPANRLRIACLSSLGVHVLPQVVRMFRAEQEDASIALQTGTSGNALAGLVSGQVEIALILRSEAGASEDLFETTEVMRDRTVAVLRRDSVRPGESLADLFRRVVVSAQPRDYASRQYLERWLREQDLSMQVRYEHSSYSGITNDVMSGDCIGIVPHYMLVTFPGADNLVEIPLPDFSHYRSVVAVYPVRPKPLVPEFVAFMRDVCASGWLDDTVELTDPTDETESTESKGLRAVS